MGGGVSLIDGHIDNAEHCVCCGAVIPEGRQVCIICGLKTNYKQSTTDVVEVVRCKDCKHYELMKSNNQYFCNEFGGYVKPDDYCSRNSMLGEE